MRRISSVALALVLVAACANHYQGYRSGDQKYPKRAADCQVELYATHPGPEYIEIGQITPEENAPRYTNPQSFKKVVRPVVCALGGDALATEMNGLGVIIRGIVFKHVASEEPAAATPAPAASGTCDPICSPGFTCDAGTCVPQCNPACDEGEACGKDRLCHPRDAAK